MFSPQSLPLASPVKSSYCYSVRFFVDSLTLVYTRLPCTTNPSGKKILKKRLKAVVTVEQMLGHDARLRHHRHEVSVAFPAWHDMPMEMIFDARAGAFAEIHA